MLGKVYRIVDRHGRASEFPYESLEYARGVLMKMQDLAPNHGPYFIWEYPA